MSILVPATGQTLRIEPLKAHSASTRGGLDTVTPTWRHGLRLPKVAWTFRALTPGSVQARTATEPSVALQPGIDFVVNDSWATVGAVESSSVAPGAELIIEFSFTESRIDLIESRPDGSLAVKKGVPHMNAPLVPDPTPECRPLFGVYLPHNTTSLSAGNINRISSRPPLIPPVQNSHPINSFWRGLRAETSATVAFLGDSITAQRDVDGGSFVQRFADHLRRRFRSHRVTEVSASTDYRAKTGEIVVVNAGVGGDSSTRGLSRFDADVAPHDPDIVVIMFGANDENKQVDGRTQVSVTEYRENIVEMIQKSRAVGAMPVVLSPAMKNLNWVATSGKMKLFAAAARQAAIENNCCFVDVHNAWERIESLGSNYMVYLNSSINHPNHLGHELFASGLRQLVDN